MARHRVSLMIRFLCLGALLAAPAVGQTIVWTDQNARKIQKKDVSGGPVQTIVQFPSPNSASQIHYDPIAAKLYYRLFGSPTTFQRADLDGSNSETIPTPSVGTFTLNVDSRKLYWVPGPSGDALHYSELDGSGAASHTYPSGTLLTVEAFGDDVFFGAGGAMAKGVWRADADGANEQFLHSTGQPTDLAYDPVENKLYIAHLPAISRMNLDGSGFEQVVSLPQWEVDTSYPTEVVVDSWNRKLYWAESKKGYPAGGYVKVIQRSNLDGSNVEDFVNVSDVGNPNIEFRGLTIVDPAPIPTLSGWGLLVMAGAFVGAALLLLRSRLPSRVR